MRVAEFLSDQRVPFQSILHPPAYTAVNRAKYLHVAGGHVAKCVLLSGPAGHFLAILPATRQIDTEALSAELGGAVRLAEEHEVARVFGDCEWGVASPFGSQYGIRTYLEESVPAHALIVVEGNSHAEAIRICGGDFERLEKPRRLRFAR
jgi:Ala-tRNA(Pro) deacylase